MLALILEDETSTTILLFLFLCFIVYYINKCWPVKIKEEYDPDSIDP